MSNGITSVFTSEILENWAKSAQQGESGLDYSKTISWQGFVNKVLAAAAPDLSGDNNKQMYVPGSGYYNTDNRGFLVNNSGAEIWDTSLNNNKALLNAIAGSGATVYQNQGASGPTGWMIRPAIGKAFPLGIPQCGPAKIQLSDKSGVDGIIQPWSGCLAWELSKYKDHENGLKHNTGYSNYYSYASELNEKLINTVIIIEMHI